MSSLAIKIEDGRKSFAPGDNMVGQARWDLDSAPENIEVRLLWYTRGKGTEDVSVENVRAFESPARSGEGSFSFLLPEAPFSFSGTLISLVWALELVVLPGGDAERCEFVLAPGGREIELPHIEDPTKVAYKKMKAKVQGRR